MSKYGVRSVFDSLIWSVFLLFLLGLSFVTTRFDSSLWQSFSSGFYFYCALATIGVMLGWVRVNIGALRAALPVIALQGAIIAWLLLQTLLPGSIAPLFAWYTEFQSPTWYQPASRISLTPEKTEWLVLSAAFILALSCMALALVRNRTRLKQFLSTLAVIALLHAGIGILALQQGLFLIDTSQVDGHFSVARGFFVNRNHFAALLGLSACGLWALSLSHVSRVLSRPAAIINGGLSVSLTRSLIVLLGIAIVLLGLILSQSRAGLLAPSLVLTVAMSHFATQRDRRLWCNSLLLLAILSVGAISLLLWQGEAVLVRLQDVSLGERLTQWEITLEAISRSPWVGFGGGSYAVVFQTLRDHADLRQVIYNQAHNEYLHIWLEQGLLGLSLWLGILLYSLWFALKALRASRSRLVAATLVASIGGVLGALFQAGVDFNLQIVNLRGFFFLLLALIYIAPLIHHQYDRSAQ